MYLSFLVFFLPDVKESADLKARIEAYGGKVVEQHECGSYQIRPLTSTELDFVDFYKGDIYDQSFIDDSIASNWLQSKSSYSYYSNDSESALRLNIGKRKKFTIMEGISLYNLLGAGKYGKIPNETYKNIEN